MRVGATISLILTASLLSSPALADEFSGGTGLFHTQAAELLAPGKLIISSQSRAFAASIEDPVNGGTFMLANGTNVLNASFGFSPHFELDAGITLYQDLNVSGTSTQTKNVPDDATVRLRWGNYQASMMGKTFLWGLFIRGRLNSSNLSNVYLEPYSSESNSFELGGILSYYDNPLYPRESWNAHLNLSYMNHNDSGVHDRFQLLNDVTQEWQYAIGYRYPTLRWDFMTELYGSVFTDRPDQWAFSRANYAYVSAGTELRMFYGLSLALSADFNVFTSDLDQPLIVTEGYPDFYPPWHIFGKINFSPSTAFSKTNTWSSVRPESEIDLEVRNRTGLSGRDLIDWLGTDEEGAEFIDLELEKIRAERKEAELELERLKEHLRSRGTR